MGFTGLGALRLVLIKHCRDCTGLLAAFVLALCQVRPAQTPCAGLLDAMFAALHARIVGFSHLSAGQADSGCCYVQTSATAGACLLARVVVNRVRLACLDMAHRLCACLVAAELARQEL